MKLLKNTKYILMLLAGIMLVTGCGDKGKGGGAGGSVDPELEKKQEEILKALEPLYLEAEKERLVSDYDEATAKKNFKKEYTDPKANSFVAKFNFVKALFEKTAETGPAALYELRHQICENITKIENDINSVPYPAANHAKRKAYKEKDLELNQNLLEMIDKMMGVETGKNDTGNSK